jgi:hypothetical protein
MAPTSSFASLSNPASQPLQLGPTNLEPCNLEQTCKTEHCPELFVSSILAEGRRGTSASVDAAAVGTHHRSVDARSTRAMSMFSSITDRLAGRAGGEGEAVASAPSHSDEDVDDAGQTRSEVSRNGVSERERMTREMEEKRVWTDHSAGLLLPHASLALLAAVHAASAQCPSRCWCCVTKALKVQPLHLKFLNAGI